MKAEDLYVLRPTVKAKISHRLSPGLQSIAQAHLELKLSTGVNAVNAVDALTEAER